MPKSETDYVWKGIPYSDLSSSYDPHNVYVSRALSLASKAKPGLERFAYQVFGPQLIGSLAFALDPYSEYRFPTMKITPTNRSTTIPAISRRSRSFRDTVVTETVTSRPDPAQPCGLASTTGASGVVRTKGTTYNSVVNCTQQEPVFGVRKDTTVRTRPLGSKGGEFELFIPYIDAPPRVSTSRDESRVIVFANTDCLYQHSEQNYDRRVQGLSSGFYVDPASFNSCLTNERSKFTSKTSSLAFGMLRECVPSNRNFSLAYNIAELKDLPLLLKRSVELIKDFSSLLTLKGQGNQYLNLKFGWEATIRAVNDMLRVPEEIARKVNYLIERNGTATSFSTTRKGVDGYDGAAPLAFFDAYPLDYGVTVAGNQYRREWSMRAVVNYQLKFPKIDIPILRQELLDTKWGVNPNPSDVYNLVPWTWLVDWFGGLGEYINLMNTLAEDPNLVNYGYLTYKAKFRCPITHTSKRDNQRVVNIDGVVKNSSFTTSQHYAGEMGYKYQRRVDISTIGGVKAISRPSSLGAEQLAIIGALLTKFTSS